MKHWAVPDIFLLESGHGIVILRKDGGKKLFNKLMVSRQGWFADGNKRC